MHVTAPTVFRVPGHACDKLCREANGPASSCTCACGGECHGVARPALEAALSERLGRIAANPFTRIPALDEGAF